MQRAMDKYKNIETEFGTYSLAMRVGLHVGKFLIADIGTPHRMEHVLLGKSVLRAKHAEGSGEKGFVCLTKEVRDKLGDEFRFKKHVDEHFLVEDDLTDEDLGDYDILAPQNTHGKHDVV